MNNFTNKRKEQNDYNANYTKSKEVFEEIWKDLRNSTDSLFSENKESWSNLNSINSVILELANLLEKSNPEKAEEYRKKIK